MRQHEPAANRSGSDGVIAILGLRLIAVLGVSEDERRHPQTVEADIRFAPAAGFAGLDDRIERAVDYAAAAESARAIAAERPRALLETLVCDLADGLLEKYPLRRVEVEVRKFILPDAHAVSARAVRSHDA